MKRVIVQVVGVAVLLAIPLACSTEPKSPEMKASLSSDVGAALQRFRAADPGLQDVLERAAAYAVIPDVGKAGLAVGGAYGKGEVFENGQRVGYCDLTQASAGLQLGAQTYDELILFKTPGAFERFKGNQLSFGAHASAVVIKPGAATAAVFADGVAVLVQTTGGLMAELSIAGQRVRFQPQ
jgi:lipid-binding SYLF domain-containing protein